MVSAPCPSLRATFSAASCGIRDPPRLAFLLQQVFSVLNLELGALSIQREQLREHPRGDAQAPLIHNVHQPAWPTPGNVQSCSQGRSAGQSNACFPPDTGCEWRAGLGPDPKLHFAKDWGMGSQFRSICQGLLGVLW